MPTDTSYHGELGDHFVQLSSRHPTNVYIDRPAMLALIGDVAGLQVLDVGFVLERLLEPRPDEALRAVDPEEFERIGARASVLTVAMRRPGSGG